MATDKLVVYAVNEEHTAIHEAGHFVVAEWLEVPSKSISVVPCGSVLQRGAVAGQLKLKEGPLTAGNKLTDLERKTWMLHSIMVTLAGNEATRIKYKWRKRADGDRREALLLAMTSGWNSSDEATTACLRWLRSAVRAFLLLPENWARVEAVAAALVEKKALRSVEARAIANRAAKAVLQG